jgi:hypothetical protein
MVISTEESGNLQLDPLLLAACGQQQRISSPALRPSSSDVMAEAPESGLDIVRLVETGLKPGTWGCPSIATLASEPIALGARSTPATQGWGCRGNYTTAGDAGAKSAQALIRYMAKHKPDLRQVHPSAMNYMSHVV